jgi:broad specificity phosphatase PhoE
MTARRLSELPVTGIHSSTMGRAVETCDIIAERFPGVPVERTDILRESLPSVPLRFPRSLPRPSRAAIAANRRRADVAFRRYFKRAPGEDRCDLIVCHGNLIRYLVSTVLGLGVRSWGSLGTHNCGISEVRITSRGDKLLVSHNDVGHIPLRHRTS